MTKSAWGITISPRGERDLKRLDRSVRERVYAALRQQALNPTGGLLKLTGREGHRLRVGAWRVLITLDRDLRVMRVNRVLPRGRAYDR